MTHDFEEYHEWTLWQSWLFIVALCIGLIGWCMTMMMLLPEVPRHWDFGVREFTPAKSIYSSVTPQRGAQVDVLAPLPEANPSSR